MEGSQLQERNHLNQREDSQQQLEDNFNEMNKAIELLTQTNLKVKSLKISTFQRWKGCQQLKTELIQKLGCLKTKLILYKKILKYRTQRLRERLDKTAFAKYFVKLGKWTKILVSTCIVIAGLVGAFFGFQLVALLAGFLGFTLQGVSAVLGIIGTFAGFAGGIVLTVNLLVLWDQACQNKKKFEEANSQAQKALDGVDKEWDQFQRQNKVQRRT